MPARFDSRPLVLRRAYTATMRATTVIAWRHQVNHGLQLFFIIAASVIARNVANQQVLDAPPPAGPDVLGRLYVAVALVAGLSIALVGYIGRNLDPRRVASVAHLGAALILAAGFVVPGSDPYLAIGKYVAMEASSAVLLLVFGIMISARMGPRDARRMAARVGAGGILGGLAGGATLSLGAAFLGSRNLFLVAAALAVAPVFWLPRTDRRGLTSVVGEVPRDRADVPQLESYGRWVAVTTLVMVATTTLIDYVYRSAARTWYHDDQLTAFFGMVVILSGLVTLLFQVTALETLLDRAGLFATATVMPAALIVFGAAFGLVPTLGTLVLLKLVDSGANMSVQQVTGGLLLAPLGARARAVWQGRIDGLARRAGQLLTGGFLAFFPWAPLRVLPVALLLCALWVGILMTTRRRYVHLLTAMIRRPPAHDPEVQVYDGGTLRLLERELALAAPARAAVILDLLEQAEHRAPDDALARLVELDPHGPGVLAVIDHLSAFEDVAGLTLFTQNHISNVAGAALLALDEVDPSAADAAARRMLLRTDVPEELRGLAAGLLAGHNIDARALAGKLARSPQVATRLAVAQALGRLEPGSPPEIGETLCVLARDEDVTVARTALEPLPKHLSTEAARVSLEALDRPTVRGAGMRALAGLGPPVVSAISTELQARLDEPGVASALAWALGHIGLATGIGALVDALSAEHTTVRLSAAVALTSLVRRRPDVELPFERIEAHYVPELQHAALLRDGLLCGLPETPAGRVLRRTLRQRASASLEILFRLLALRFPEDSITAAFHAVSSRDRARRQVALELLDTFLDAKVRQALAIAIGEATSGRRRARERDAVLLSLTTAGDSFVAELASLVKDELDGRTAGRASTLTRKNGMQRSLVDHILELQSVSLFSQASAEDLADVAAFLGERDVPGGAVIYNEGEPGDALYLIRSGAVVLSRNGQVVEKLGSGDAFGIVAVLDRLPRELTATAQGPASLMMLKAADLHQLLADRPLLMHSIFRALTDSIRDQLERVELGKSKSG